MKNIRVYTSIRLVIININNKNINNIKPVFETRKK